MRWQVQWGDFPQGRGVAQDRTAAYLRWGPREVLVTIGILDKGRRRAINIAKLVIIHRGIEAFSMRSPFQRGFKLFIHMLSY
jgi:hypothetical protein